MPYCRSIYKALLWIYRALLRMCRTLLGINTYIITSYETKAYLMFCAAPNAAAGLVCDMSI